MSSSFIARKGQQMARESQESFNRSSLKRRPKTDFFDKKGPWDKRKDQYVDDRVESMKAGMALIDEPFSSPEPSSSDESDEEAGPDGRVVDFEEKKALIMQMENGFMNETVQVVDLASTSIEGFKDLQRALRDIRDVHDLMKNPLPGSAIPPGHPAAIPLEQHIENALTAIASEAQNLVLIRHMGQVMKNSVSRQQTAINLLKRPKPRKKPKRDSEAAVRKGMSQYELWLAKVRGVFSEQVTQRLGIALKQRAHVQISTAFRAWVHRVRVLKRVLFHWRNQAATKCFRHWRENTGRVQAHKAILEKCAARLVNRSLARAMETWQNLKRDMKARRQRAHQVLTKMKNFVVARAMEKWLFVAMDSRLRRLRGKQAAVARMVNAYVFKGFNRWAEAVAELQERRARMRGVMARMQRACAGRAFNTWLEAWEEALERQARLKRALLRIANLKLATAFSTWSGNVAEVQASRGKMKQVMVRLGQRHLSMAWNQWKGNYKEAKRQRQLVAKALARMANRLLAMGWDMFLALIDQKYDLQAKMLRAVAYMQKRTVAMAFRQWESSTEEVRTIKARTGRALKFMTNASLARGWGSWRALLQEKWDNEEKMDRVLRRMSRLKEAQGFDRWYEYAQEQIAKRLKQRRAMGLWAGDTQRNFFYLWMEAVEVARDNEELLGRCIRRIMKVKLVMGWNTWRDSIEYLKVTRTKLRKVVHRMKHAQLFAGFNAWRQAAAAFSKQVLKDQVLKLRKAGCRALAPLLQLTLRGIDDAELAMKVKYETIRHTGAGGARPAKSAVQSMIATIETLEAAEDLGHIDEAEVEELERCAMAVLLRELEGLHLSVAAARATIHRDRESLRRKVIHEASLSEFEKRAVRYSHSDVESLARRNRDMAEPFLRPDEEPPPPPATPSVTIDADLAAKQAAGNVHSLDALGRPRYFSEGGGSPPGSPGLSPPPRASSPPIGPFRLDPALERSTSFSRALASARRAPQGGRVARAGLTPSRPASAMAAGRAGPGGALEASASEPALGMRRPRSGSPVLREVSPKLYEVATSVPSSTFFASPTKIAGLGDLYASEEDSLNPDLMLHADDPPSPTFPAMLDDHGQHRWEKGGGVGKAPVATSSDHFTGSRQRPSSAPRMRPKRTGPPQIIEIPFSPSSPTIAKQASVGTPTSPHSPRISSPTKASRIAGGFNAMPSPQKPKSPQNASENRLALPSAKPSIAPFNQNPHQVPVSPPKVVPMKETVGTLLGQATNLASQTPMPNPWLMLPHIQQGIAPWDTPPGSPGKDASPSPVKSKGVIDTLQIGPGSPMSPPQGMQQTALTWDASTRSPSRISSGRGSGVLDTREIVTSIPSGSRSPSGRPHGTRNLSSRRNYHPAKAVLQVKTVPLNIGQ